jgi:choice-of-anchor C domain-containing protein
MARIFAQLVGVAAALSLLVPATAGANLIVSGSFELPATSLVMDVPAGDPSLVGWTVVSGSVDVVNGVYYPAFVDSQSLDMDGVSAGTITQSFTTTIGSTYNLTFEFANNFRGGTVPAQATVSVLGAGPTPRLSQGLVHSDSSFGGMDYQLFSGLFTADSATTTLRFTSTDPANSLGGIVLDAVSVTPAPEPTGIALLCGACIIGLARRSGKTSM